MIDQLKSYILDDIKASSQANRIYAGITCFMTFLAMILTSCSPKVLLDFFGSILTEFFPMITLVSMQNMESEDQLTFFLIFIILEYLTTFISYIMNDKLGIESDIFTWIGNVFLGIFITVMQVSLFRIGIYDKFVSYWIMAIMFVLVIVASIVIIIQLGKVTTNGFFAGFGIIGLMMKYSWFITYYMLLFPMLSMLIPAFITVAILFIVMFLTSWIPIAFIQQFIELVVCVCILLGYYFICKNSNWLIDKLKFLTIKEPYDVIVPVGRGIIAIVIQLSAIWVLLGNTLPLWNIILNQS